MEPFLCFLGGCEFEYISHELQSDPEKYFDFDYFYSFEHRARTDPYAFLAENAQEVFEHTGRFYNEEQFMRKYVSSMEELAVRYPNFYFFNLTNTCAMHGFKQTLKPADAPWYSHIKFPATHLAREYSCLVDYLLKLSKKVKCVIVDLDNTMWNGVIRDVGVENIEIRIDKERFRWNVLSILFARGILTGVISKNDSHFETDIKEFIKPNLAGMEFVSFRLNWKDKWENLLEIQQRIKSYPKWFSSPQQDIEKASVLSM